jgi:hypothetical protein
MTTTTPDYAQPETAESTAAVDYGTEHFLSLGGAEDAFGHIVEDSPSMRIHNQNEAGIATATDVLASNASSQFSILTAGGGGGVGDVSGPGTVVDERIPRWDGTTGRLLQTSTAALTDAGALSGLTTIVCSSNITIGATAVVQNSSTHERITFAATSGGRLDFYSADTLHMRLDSTGDLELAQGDLDVQTGDILGAGDIDIVGNIDLDGSIFMKERAEAQANVAAYGQFWIKTATPNQPWFDTDAGTELPLLLSTAAITDNAIPRGDGGVYSLQNSSVLISDTNSITGVDDLTCGGSIVVGDNEVIQNASTHERINFASSAGGRLDFYSANALNMQLTGADLEIPNGDLDVGNDFTALGNTHAFGDSTVVDTHVTITVESDWRAAIILNSDSNNSAGEPGGAYIHCQQDGENVGGMFGITNVSNQRPDGGTFTGAAGNDVVIAGTDAAGAIVIGNNDAVELTIDTDVTVANDLIVTDNITGGNSLFLGQQAAADADVSNYGQIWIKNTTPTELWFTDDAGTDTKIV